jgi:NH3-dependent NAD+ synthetase
MNASLVTTAVILAIALAAIGVAAMKFPKARKVLAGAGGGIAAAIAAVVAVLVLNKEKKRAGEVVASTKEVRLGRQDAKEDSSATEAAIEQEVAAEEGIHEKASSEQEELKTMKRERLKA